MELGDSVLVLGCRHLMFRDAPTCNREARKYKISEAHLTPKKRLRVHLTHVARDISELILINDACVWTLLYSQNAPRLYALGPRYGCMQEQ
jgi:hypothetical protein